MGITENGYSDLKENPIETSDSLFEEFRQSQIQNLWELTRFIAGHCGDKLNHVEAEKMLGKIDELRVILRAF